MPDIKDSVGIGGANRLRDVALVQAMLRVVNDAKNNPYLPGPYDGVFGGVTKAAIERFQIEQKLASAPVTPAQAAPGAPAAKNAPPPAVSAAGVATEKLGFIGAGSLTFQKLSALLPATHQNMRTNEGCATVYIEGEANSATASWGAIVSDTEYETGFRVKLGALVQQMYATHKIVLWITPTGRRRTFAQQAAETKTNAGPGESNHNFGRAADIGFRDFKWVRGDGTIATDRDWLNSLETAKAAEAARLWDARDAIAATQGLFPLNFERVHLQAFKQTGVSNQRSLVNLLNNVGQMEWKTGYQSDLQSGSKHWAQVGSARDIWAGNASVSKFDLAKARSAATGTLVKESDIKQQDITAMRNALKADFEQADVQWVKWTPVP